jgi:hypothetical protein
MKQNQSQTKVRNHATPLAISVRPGRSASDVDVDVDGDGVEPEFIDVLPVITKEKKKVNKDK